MIYLYNQYIVLGVLTSKFRFYIYRDTQEQPLSIATYGMWTDNTQKWQTVADSD